MTIRVLSAQESRILIEKSKPKPTFFLDKIFTGLITSDTDVINIEALPDNGRKLAPRVSPRMPGLPVGTTGSRVTSFRPTYLKLNTPVDPSGIFEATNADPFSVLYERDAMKRHANARANIIKDHVSRINQTWEFMAAMAAINGYVDTAYLGAPQERVEFGRDAALTFVNATSAYWDAAGASILDDLKRFKRAMSDADGGGKAAFMLVGSRVADVLTKSALSGELKDLFDTRYGMDGTTLVRGLREDEPISYLGRISGLGEVYEYSAVFEDVDNDGAPVSIKPLKDNEIAMFAANIEGYKAFGRIKDLAAGYKAYPIFGRNGIVEGDPQVEFVAHQSAPIMIPAAPNRTLKATVLAAA